MHQKTYKIREYEQKLHSGFESIYPTLKYEPDRKDLCLIKRRIAVINAMDSLSDYGYSYRRVTIDSEGIFVEDKISDIANGGMGTYAPESNYFSNETLDKLFVKFKSDEFRTHKMRPIHPHRTIYGEFIR